VAAGLELRSLEAMERPAQSMEAEAEAEERPETVTHQEQVAQVASELLFSSNGRCKMIELTSDEKKIVHPLEREAKQRARLKIAMDPIITKAREHAADTRKPALTLSEITIWIALQSVL
jgi:hypothetical protein